jgi:type II secretory pathway pseudopilin PulG
VRTAPDRPRRAPRGISLLEAVVAIAIVGMTAISALESVGSGMRTAEKSRRAIEAEALASSRLEFMDLMTETQLQSLPDSVAKGQFEKPLDEYSWTTTSSPLDEQAGVYDVRITVTWPTGNYTVRTYLYRQPAFSTRR